MMVKVSDVACSSVAVFMCKGESEGEGEVSVKVVHKMC